MFCSCYMPADSVIWIGTTTVFLPWQHPSPPPPLPHTQTNDMTIDNLLVRAANNQWCFAYNYSALYNIKSNQKYQYLSLVITAVYKTIVLLSKMLNLIKNQSFRSAHINLNVLYLRAPRSRSRLSDFHPARLYSWSGRSGLLNGLNGQLRRLERSAAIL